MMSGTWADAGLRVVWTDFPSVNEFISAEIGSVNAYTVAVTYNQLSGLPDVLIKVNGTPQPVSNKTAVGSTVKYTIPVLWHGSDDVVTLEYLGQVHSVVNNVAWVSLLDLQADALVLAENDPVSTWADQSVNGHDFTAVGSARPLKKTVDSYPAVVPDGTNDFMTGDNFADDPDSFCVIVTSKIMLDTGGTGVQVMKMNGYANPPGWGLGYGSIYLETGVLDYIGQGANSLSFGNWNVVSYIENPRGTLHVYVNGAEDSSPDNFGTFTTFSNTEPLTLFTNGQVSFNKLPMYSTMILAPAPGNADRAALELRLAERYGVTL